MLFRSNEGYKASSGERLVREDLCHEAIRLALQLAAHPATCQPRTHALLALMLFNAARLSARTDDAGHLLRLHEQDRATWNQAMIIRGAHYLALSCSGGAVSEYHLQAGIAACHTIGPHETRTDWPRVLALYDQLLAMTGSPVTAMNRAVAVARVHGPEAGLNALDHIKSKFVLESQHLYHALRGTFAHDLGDTAAALTSFHQAAALATLPAERDFIAKRIEESGGAAVKFNMGTNEIKPM